MGVSGKKEDMSEAELEQRAKAPLKHGGAAAVVAFREGNAFTGLAAEAEREVREDLEEHGQREMQKELAVRLHVCTRLYYGAIQKSADAGDLEGFHRYAQKFGWLAGKTAKAWKQLGEMPSEDESRMIEAALANTKEIRERQKAANCSTEGTES